MVSGCSILRGSVAKKNQTINVIGQALILLPISFEKISEKFPKGTLTKQLEEIIHGCLNYGSVKVGWHPFYPGLIRVM